MNRSNQHIDSALGLDLAQLTSHGDDMDEYDVRIPFDKAAVSHTPLSVRIRVPLNRSKVDLASVNLY